MLYNLLVKLHNILNSTRHPPLFGVVRIFAKKLKDAGTR